jgi:hypothetical protein
MELAVTEAITKSMDEIGVEATANTVQEDLCARFDPTTEAHVRQTKTVDFFSSIDIQLYS